MSMKERIKYLLEKYEKQTIAVHQVRGRQTFLDDYDFIHVAPPSTLCA